MKSVVVSSTITVAFLPVDHTMVILDSALNMAIFQCTSCGFTKNAYAFGDDRHQIGLSVCNCRNAPDNGGVAARLLEEVRIRLKLCRTVDDVREILKIVGQGGNG